VNRGIPAIDLSFMLRLHDAGEGRGKSNDQPENHRK
jgi:hypothetical protein